MRVENIALLTRDGLGDLVLSDVTSLSRDMYVAAFQVIKPGQRLRSDDFLDTLIVDLAQFHVVVGDMPEWFSKNIYWATPGQDTSPPSAMRLDSKFFSVHLDSLLVITELYGIKGQLEENFLGTWNKENGLQVDVPEIWERRKDLKGMELITTTLAYPPFYCLEPIEDGQQYDGYMPELLYTIQDIANFTVKWINPADGYFGAPVGNGSWNGMVGQVKRREADIIVTGLAVTFVRSTVADYSIPVLDEKTTMVILNPAFVSNQEEINFTAFLSVFTLESWLLLAFLLFLLATFNFLIWRTTMQTSRRSFTEDINESVGFAYKALLQLEVSTRGTYSYNILFLTASAYAILAMAYYEGVLTSFMTARLPPPPMQSYFDIVKLDYKVIVQAGSQQETLLKTAPPGSGRHAIYHKLVKNNPSAYLKPGDDKKKALLSGPRVAMEGSEFEFPHDSRFLSLPGLDEARDDTVAFAFQKDTELLGLFNYYIIRMYQSATIEFLTHKWIGLRKPMDICDKNQLEVASLGYSNLLFPSLILSSGEFLLLDL